MVGTYVFIKFGKYHGMKGKVVGETVRESDGQTFYAVKVDLDDKCAMVVKKAQNTVKMLPANK